MFQPRVRFLLLISLLVAVLATPAHAAPVPPTFMGVDVDDQTLLSHPELLASEAAVMRRAGVRSVRIPVYWPDMQGSANGPINFRQLDNDVAVFSRQRLQILPLVLYAPGWDAADPQNDVNPFVTASAPARDQPYANFVAALASRYGSRGTFWKANPSVPRNPIPAWQVWNEPSLGLFWEQQPFAPGYVALLRATRPALRRADPKAKLVLAGLANDSWNALQKIYAAGGRGLFDEVALHPYSATPARVMIILNRDLAVLNRNHDTRIHIEVTEMGYSSAAGSGVTAPKGVTWNTTEAGQAKGVTALYTTLAANRTRLRLDAAYWYSWYTPEYQNSPHWENYTGLRNAGPNGTVRAKPAFNAYAAIAHKLER